MNDQLTQRDPESNGAPAAPVPAPPSRRGALQASPWLVLACALLITWGIWNYAAITVDRTKHDYFDFRVREAIARVLQRIETYQTVLLGVQGLYNSSENVERHEFTTYVEGLHLADHYPGIQGIGFSVIIPAAAKERHIAAVRKEGFPGYTVRPEGRRALYTSIIYLEPFSDRNLRAFGYDMYSEPVQRAAMDAARDSGQMAMTGKVRLVQESGVREQAGFLLYLPIYRNSPPHATVAERRASIIGWAYSPFRMDDLMGGIFGEHAGDLDIEIYDGEEATTDTLMYDSDGSLAASAPRQMELHSGAVIEIAGRAWTVRIRALEGLLSRVDSNRPALIAIAGIVISLLLTWLTWSLVTGRERAIQAVREREKLIAELQKAAVEIKTLRGVLPICSVCKKIRDDKDAWNQMEEFISQHADVEFSHGYCPDCARKALEEAKEFTKKNPR